MAYAVRYQSLHELAGDDGRPRPYLEITLIGPNQDPQPIIGLVDTGADFTTLPFDAAELLGYSDDALEDLSGSVSQAGGEASAYRATVPTVASVSGGPTTEFEMWPLFMRDGEMVLWGRGDFMAHFDVWISESQMMFEFESVED